MKQYKLAACGGTFDLFHKGHKSFLISIFKLSEKIVIGITSDDFALSKNNLEPFELRKKAVEEFLNLENINAEIIEIDDVFGPTLSDKYHFDALFVTEDSVRGASLINTKRKELGLGVLEVNKIKLLNTLDGKTLSSTRIRNGEVDREGNIYIDRNLLDADYLLPDNLRKSLSRPFGELIVDFDQWISVKDFDLSKTVTVGDAITKSFVKLNLIPRLAIVDLQINRKKAFSDIFELGFDENIKFERVKNPAGGISHDLINLVKDVFESDISAIQIVGEDDLAVIPVVLSAPLSYEIYYGQPARLTSESVAGRPGKGVVRIVVTEEKKNEIKNLISKFERKVI